MQSRGLEEVAGTGACNLRCGQLSAVGPPSMGPRSSPPPSHPRVELCLLSSNVEHHFSAQGLEVTRERAGRGGPTP